MHVQNLAHVQAFTKDSHGDAGRLDSPLGVRRSCPWLLLAPYVKGSFLAQDHVPFLSGTARIQWLIDVGIQILASLYPCESPVECSSSFRVPEISLDLCCHCRRLTSSNPVSSALWQVPFRRAVPHTCPPCNFRVSDVQSCKKEEDTSLPAKIKPVRILTRIRNWRQIRGLGCMYCLLSEKFFLSWFEVPIRKIMHNLEFHKYVWLTKVKYSLARTQLQASFRHWLLWARWVWDKYQVIFIF